MSQIHFNNETLNDVIGPTEFTKRVPCIANESDGSIVLVLYLKVAPGAVI